MAREIVGIIPVREGSERVKGKNFIEFADGKSLLDVKINHLKEAECFDHIYISSDSVNAEKIAGERGVEFLRRDSAMCRADVYWADVVEHIMETIPGDPLVVWALVTSPLFSGFRRAVDTFLAVEGECDSLVAVLPKKSFFLNKFGRGINFNPGYWHPYSQQLETYYEVTGACYIGLKSDMRKWKYWFGPKPYLFEVPAVQSVDVDTPDDFDLAKKMYKAVNDGA
ncbi:MAG: CMP-N-acetylneuraminic acid synthetase [Candidatus Omnitrophota bacterium]